MSAARVRSTTTSKYDRTQRSKSYSGPISADGNDSSASESSHLPIHTNEKAARHLRAGAQKRVSHSSRREPSRMMASHQSRRTYSDSKVYQAQDSRSTGNEVHRKEESRQRHRSRRANHGEYGDRDDRGHMTRQTGRNIRGAERGRPHDLKRSKTTGEKSRANHERSHKADEALPRRYSENNPSTYEDKRERAPQRREKRSNAVNATVAKNKPRPR